MKPKISVLMTVYNGEKFLEETIESVLNQTFGDFELIIIDDGSTDNTKEIIMKFAKWDKRIKYYYFGKNKGYYYLDEVINEGLRKCKGKYIARIDADDLCNPNRLEVQYNYLEKNKDIFLIGSSAEVIDYHGKKIGSIFKKPFSSIFHKYHVAVSNSFVHSSIMFRNEGIYYPSHNEHMFYCLLVFYGKKIRNIPWFLVQYRINPFGVMSKHADLTDNPYKKYYEKEKSK